MKKRTLNRSFESMKNNLCDTSYGLCPAPLRAQDCLDILIDYLLGENWSVVTSMNQEQANACAVEQILNKYSKQWQGDWKSYIKLINNKKNKRPY